MVYHRPVEKYHTLNALLLGPPLESRLPEASHSALEKLIRFCREMIADNPDDPSVARYFGQIIEASLSEQENRKRLLEEASLSEQENRKRLLEEAYIESRIPEASDTALAALVFFAAADMLCTNEQNGRRRVKTHER